MKAFDSILLEDVDVNEWINESTDNFILFLQDDKPIGFKK